MLRVGRAAAVAGEHHLVAGAKRRFHRMRDREHGDAELIVIGRALEHVERAPEMRGNGFGVPRGLAPKWLRIGYLACRTAHGGLGSVTAGTRQAGRGPP